MFQRTHQELAYGLAAADVVHEEQQPCAEIYSETSDASLWKSFQQLTKKAVHVLQQQGFTSKNIVGWFIFLSNMTGTFHLSSSFYLGSFPVISWS